MKAADAYGLVCTGDPDTMVNQARANGYVVGRQSTVGVTHGHAIVLGTFQSALIRNAPSGESEQIIVGGSCEGHRTRVLLTYHWDG